MKLFRGAILAGILTSACVISAGATWTGVGTVTGDGVRLRAEASTECSTITYAVQGAKVAVLEALDGWYKVDCDTQIGYMSADYVTVEAEVDGDLGYGVVATESGTLNLREGAGTDYAQVTALPNGAVVKLDGLTDGWLKISYNGCVGYASSDYVKMAQDANGTRKDAQGASASAPSSLAATIISYANSQLGKPYVWGGSSTSGFDCSGFTSWVARQCGITIPRTASAQYAGNPGVKITSMSDLQPGDLVYICNPAYANGHPVSHTMIYLGNNQVIHASSTKRVVMIQSFEGYKKYFKGAWRLG